MTNFQEKCIAECKNLLKEVVGEDIYFKENPGKYRTYYTATVKLKEHLIELEIYTDDPIFIIDDDYWKIFERPDFDSYEKLIESFIAKLAKVIACIQNPQVLIEKIQKICKSGLRGELRIRDFRRTWPEEANAIPFYHQIYKDAENLIKHIPHYWLKSGINYKKLNKSRRYFSLYLDSFLINYCNNFDTLMQCRKKVLLEGNLSEEIIESKVKECLKIK